MWSCTPLLAVAVGAQSPLLRVEEARPLYSQGTSWRGQQQSSLACLSQQILPWPRSQRKFVVTTKVIFFFNQTAYTLLLIGDPWALSNAFLLLPFLLPHSLPDGGSAAS